MNPFLAAIMRIAAQHYGGGRLNSIQGRTWLARVGASPEARDPRTQAALGYLGNGIYPTQAQIMGGGYGLKG
jgi:hypothetical protein